MKALMRDIPPTWLVDSEIFPGKLAVRLQLDADRTYYAIVDFEEVVDAVMWRKQHEPEKKNWKHNIPLRHDHYLIVETSEDGKIRINKLPASELALFAAICTVEEDTLEIEN